MSVPRVDEPPGVARLYADLNTKAVGRELYERIRRLYPICRSITGNGLRESLHLVGSEIDLQIHEVPTGTRVLDWIIPKEWNIRDAYIKDPSGTRIVDFTASNLHVVSYSVPVRRRMTLAELKPHLFTSPEQPAWIPYRTSYYNETWGFCLSHDQLAQLPDDEYDVCIDSTLQDGHLTYGECLLPGQQPDEVLISCHICHPSMCNDNLSGVSVAVTLARLLGRASRRYSYRLLFIPGTIGAITWLALNEATVTRIEHGLVLSCLGDRGTLTYKRSRRGDAGIDRLAAHVLNHRSPGSTILDFSPFGYDERQYCSPGFNLPVGALSRTPHGSFPQYHTSADNLDFIDPGALGDSLAACLAIVAVLERNRKYLNLSPKGEPQLGPRGLYESTSGHSDVRPQQLALLWVLNLSDGSRDLLAISERSGLPFDVIHHAAALLQERGLLAPA